MTRRRSLPVGQIAVALVVVSSMEGCLRPPSQPPATGKVAAPPAPVVVDATPPRPIPGLPASIAWKSTDAVIVPQSDAKHALVAVKDPTVVRYNDRWHVYASSVARGGIYGMVYTSFADWSDAPEAPLYYMDKTPGFNTYVAAPQLFYFSPQKKWYLVFQSGPPMFATADDPGDPSKWTEPSAFFAKTPKIIEENGGWLDYWVICDTQSCHMFFSDDHGRWYKTKTSIDKFPYGFSDPVVVMEESEAGRMFEACNVYKIAATGKYLALIEAFDKTSGSKRYFRSWTADSLEGPWTPVHENGAFPFAGKQNVSFGGTAWTADISHGEMIRAGHDETMVIEGSKLQYLYQGVLTTAKFADYNSIPWQLGLLTSQ